MQLRYRARLLLVCVVLASAPAAAFATTATATVAVSATVLSFCLIAATPLTFGNYTSSAALTTTASVTVTCTSGTTYNVGLDPGIGSGATVTTREMTLLTHTLGYSIYQDSGHATVWGNTIGTNTETGTGTGLLQTLTAYGQIPAGEYAAPGAYLDTVTATITY